MTTFAEVLAAQLRRDPGRPLLTFYDHATDERVELSVTTYANWVAKASGLLTDVADLERGMSLRIDLPPHWLSPVFLGAAWTVGLRVTQSDDPDAVVCGPDGLESWAARAGSLPVLACSLRPLGVRFAEPLVPALTDDATTGNDDGADHGVRRRLPPPFTGESQCPAHVSAIAASIRPLVRHHDQVVPFFSGKDKLGNGSHQSELHCVHCEPLCPLRFNKPGQLSVRRADTCGDADSCQFCSAI